MISIQVAGVEILTNKPRKLYFFVGSEYGIKDEYIRILAEHYGEILLVDTVDSVYTLMSHKRLFPLKPAVYVCRYDDSFISKVDQAYATKLLQCNIIGTLVCIYEQPKHATKLDRFFPDNTVAIDNVAPDIQLSYLSGRCPSVPQHVQEIIVSMSSSYGQAKLICSTLEAAKCAKVFQLSDAELRDALGDAVQSNEKMLRRGIASRNFKYIVKLLDEYDDLNGFLYAMLGTFVELDKLMYSPRSNSDRAECAKSWNTHDIYSMFCNTYSELLKSRSETTDLRSRIIYLISLMQFNPIPNLEVSHEF